MTYHAIKNTSYAVSVIVHLILLAIFLLVKISTSYPPQDLVELTFGQTGLPGSSGALGDQINNVEQQVAKQEPQKEAHDKKEELKKVDLPKAQNTSENNVIKPGDNKKDKTDNSKNQTDQTANSNVNLPGKGNRASGNGSFGDDIDWGGQGQRKIYSYIIPPYPEGVDKSIDIRLKFVIMPDGTVGTIIPLTKADTRLETAAINSLRQWRFEPLNAYQKKVPQTAVIVFPFRLQ